MAAGGASMNVLNEIVVKLSTVVDNQGMSNMLRLMNMSGLKAKGMTAAFGAISYAMVNFVKSCASTELEIEKLAREQKKSTENTRAEQTALKALGKSMDEINKDNHEGAWVSELVLLNETDMNAEQGNKWY